MVDINLLPVEEVREVEAKRLQKKVRTYSIIAIVLTILVTVGVFGYWLYLVRQDEQLGKKINNLTSQIENLKEVESLFRVVKNKLSAIVGISAKTQNFEVILDEVAKITPQGVSLTDLTVKETNSITLKGSAVSASEFSSLVSNLLARDNPASKFSAVTVESLTRDDSGVYQFAISAKIAISPNKGK